MITHEGMPFEPSQPWQRRPNDLVGVVISVEANMGKQLPSPRKGPTKAMRTGPEVYGTDGPYQPMHGYGGKKYTFGGKHMTQM